MKKFDYSKDLKEFYKPSPKEVTIANIPTMHFLKIDGQGNPNNSEQFSKSVKALFALSYAIKFYIKKNIEMDYRVFPLEGLWWAEDMSEFSVDKKDDWKWTLMIAQPKEVNEKIIEEQRTNVIQKKDLDFLKLLRYEPYYEGQVAQIMHIGPFSEEGPSVEKVHRFLDQINGKRSAKHHEIYLSDIRRADPAKWKTIIRQPFKE